MDNNYNAQDNADLTKGLGAGQAHVMPSASIMKGGIAGLNLLELAVIGGAAFVLFKNRERLMGYLEQSGIDFEQVKKQIGSFLNRGQGGQNQGFMSDDRDEQESVGASARRGSSRSMNNSRQMSNSGSGRGNKRGSGSLSS